MSPADPADNRRQTPKRQNSLNLKQPVFLCEIIQLCCIRLRNLRYLRENNTQEYSNNLHKGNNKSPADLADLRRPNPQTSKPHKLQSVFLCEIMQPCCIPLRHLRHLRENIHARVLNQYTQKKPQCLPQIPQIIADKTPNPKTTRFLICLSLRNNTACCIPLRYLRENKHVRALNRNPKVSRRSRRFTQTNNKQQTTKQP